MLVEFLNQGENMKTYSFYVCLFLMALVSRQSIASDDSELLSRLKDAKFSLLDAIVFAEKSSGTALSAKFEMDGDEMVYSVYTAPQGIALPAESADLTEVSGSAKILPMQFKTEIFQDKEHIARASTHLTLMQLSSFNLKQVIQKALNVKKGIVYSVKNPQVRNHRAVADVSILLLNGNVATVTVDLISGKMTVQ